MVKRWLKASAILLLLSTVSGCELIKAIFGPSTDSTIHVTGVTLNKTTTTVAEGGTDQLSATVAPSNASNKGVTWTSNNSAIATVSSTGLVTGVNAGSTTVTAWTGEGSYSASCAVTVTANTAGSLTLPADGNWTSGSLSTSGGKVWYEATVIGGHTYNLNWDDSWNGSGSYSLDVYMSAYQENGVTPYFTFENSGYFFSQTISVPTGQTKVYIRVQAYTSGDTGTFALKLTDTAGYGGAIVTID